MEKNTEYIIGEEFECGLFGRLKVVESAKRGVMDFCRGCVFVGHVCSADIIGQCSAYRRKDRTNVIFEHADANKRCYLSGPMRGLDEVTYRSNFALAANRMSRRGYETVNPCDFGFGRDENYAKMMAYDLAQMRTCSSVYMLRGWKDSGGAYLEHEYAKRLGINIMYEEDEKD